jgi:hypothetical protein
MPVPEQHVRDPAARPGLAVIHRPIREPATRASATNHRLHQAHRRAIAELGGGQRRQVLTQDGAIAP